MLNIKIAWDLELNLLAPVLATNLLLLPNYINSNSSVESYTDISYKF